MGMAATPDQVTTLEEFFALPEDKSHRHELLDGVYLVSPPPSVRHQLAVMALFRQLQPAIVSRPDLILFPVLGDIVLGPRSVVQPDLFVVPTPMSADVHWRDVGLPLLAVEVLSPGSAARDRGSSDISTSGPGCRSTGSSTSTRGWWSAGGRTERGRRSFARC